MTGSPPGTSRKILMIVLSRIEACKRHELRGDIVAQLAQPGDQFFGTFFLGLVCVEND